MSTNIILRLYDNCIVRGKQCLFCVANDLIPQAERVIPGYDLASGLLGWHRTWYGVFIC